MLDLIEAVFGILGMLILSRKKANVFLAQVAFTVANICAVLYFSIFNFNLWFLIQFSIYLVLSTMGMINNRPGLTENNDESALEERKIDDKNTAPITGESSVKNPIETTTGL